MSFDWRQIPSLAALRAFEAENLRRYPDPQSLALTEALADYHGLAPDQVQVVDPYPSDWVKARAAEGVGLNPATIAPAQRLGDAGRQP